MSEKQRQSQRYIILRICKKDRQKYRAVELETFSFNEKNHHLPNTHLFKRLFSAWEKKCKQTGFWWSLLSISGDNHTQSLLSLYLSSVNLTFWHFFCHASSTSRTPAVHRRERIALSSDFTSSLTQFYFSRNIFTNKIQKILCVNRHIFCFREFGQEQIFNLVSIQISVNKRRRPCVCLWFRKIFCLNSVLSPIKKRKQEVNQLNMCLLAMLIPSSSSQSARYVASCAASC